MRRPLALVSVLAVTVAAAPQLNARGSSRPATCSQMPLF
jgi:hypothetical protein